MRKFLAALLVILFTAPSTADIISSNIRNDKRDMILFSDFKFSNTGYVSVAVSSAEISSIPVPSNLSKPDPSRTGFLLLSHELSYRYHHEFGRNPDLCALDNKFISVLFTFSDLSQSSFNKSYNVTYPDEYSIYFANCNDLSIVTMDVRAELYNTVDDDGGTTKDYLSAGEPQPFFYLSFFLLYLCLLWHWIAVCIDNRQCLEMIHLPMGVLLVMNVVYFICAFAYQHDLMVTGTHDQDHVLFYISRFLREVHFFTVMVMIGAGWCNWRRVLPDWVILNLTIVILLQVWANLSFMRMGESGPYNQDWEGLSSKFTIIDIICCVFVFLHVLCSAVSFKEATDTSGFVRSYSSLKTATDRQDVFPFLVLVYLVFTRLLNTTAVQETITLVFYMAMFYMYRPFVLDDAAEDDKCAGLLDDETETGGVQVIDR